jgi:hypothetical protein
MGGIDFRDKQGRALPARAGRGRSSRRLAPEWAARRKRNGLATAIGKTLAVISLGASLATEGADVAVLDADPTKGAHRWATQTYGGGRLI